ncbi:sialin-like [Photinus pyralis]|uniref:Sialin n=1 Tax=Photinus pyralis TaxID=7054 RepID=A0A1Y1JTQ6_PHOPY|nr:sialin-like [Photinus pyralis]
MLHKCRTYHINNNNNTDTAETSDQTYPVWMIWKKRRYVVAVMAFFGFFNAFALRVNLSIGIVAMTAKHQVILENGTTTYVKEFDWDSKVQGYVLSSFFYGYILTQVAGGWLAGKFGGKHVFGIGIAVTAALTIVSPFAAKQSYYLFMALRVIEGIFEGVTYPSIHAVWAEWAPPLERSRLAAIGFSGSYIGNVIAMPLSALLADKLGWESIFYIFGSVGLLWFVCWCTIVSNSPKQDSKISNSELKYIQDSLGEQQVSRIAKHPWKEIFTSLPVWAIIFTNFSENWGNYTLLTQLPTFMRDVLHFNLASTGIMSAIPYLVLAISTQCAGQIADWFLVKRIFNITQVRKICNSVAFLGQAVFMLLAVYVSSPYASVICLACAYALAGFIWAGFGVNHLDIAPQHASVLMGIGNTFGTVPGIVSPILTGHIVTTQSVKEWQIVFITSTCIYILGFIVYVIFASGELQPWAIHTESKDKNVIASEKHTD